MQKKSSSPIEDQFEGSSFVILEPLKRRRTCYRITKNEICFIISRGISEIYDIITHMTFLNIEAGKIFQKMHDEYGNARSEWLKLEAFVLQNQEITPEELDSAILNMSIILGRPYHETRESYDNLEKNRLAHQSNNGLFSLIYHMVKRIERDHQTKDDALTIYFTPSLMNIIGHQKYGKLWASNIDQTLISLGLHERPLHIVSANMHSVVNLIYGYGAMATNNDQHHGSITHHQESKPAIEEHRPWSSPKNHQEPINDIYNFFSYLKDKTDAVTSFAETRGLHRLPDHSGANIDCQVIDTARLQGMPLHPDLEETFPFALFDGPSPPESPLSAPDENGPDILAPSDLPVILVMDYAFGAQAFELMEQLLKPFESMNGEKRKKRVGSISIMGKAGILPGDKGDIMLATAHVCEGSSDNYLFHNDLTLEDFKLKDDKIAAFIGPMATVLGTSLQNKDILTMFKSDWNAIGLEMEGGHYQKAINAAVIKGNIPADTRIRYAYYASDNPLMTGNTLAAGAMGQEGIKPTYMITKVILKKILGDL